LDPTSFVPAPGQGALAVEARADDAAVLRLLSPLDHIIFNGALDR